MLGPVVNRGSTGNADTSPAAVVRTCTRYAPGGFASYRPERHNAMRHETDPAVPHRPSSP